LGTKTPKQTKGSKKAVSYKDKSLGWAKPPEANGRKGSSQRLEKTGGAPNSLI